jgi:hypothetical protein
MDDNIVSPSKQAFKHLNFNALPIRTSGAIKVNCNTILYHCVLDNHATFVLSKISFFRRDFALWEEASEEDEVRLNAQR